jgi:hypothetical protein
MNRGVVYTLGIHTSYKPPAPSSTPSLSQQLSSHNSNHPNTKQEQQHLLLLFYINHFYWVIKYPDQIYSFDVLIISKTEQILNIDQSSSIVQA